MLSFASISEIEMRLARQTDLITSDVGQFVVDCIVVHNHWANVDIEKVDCEEVILSVDLYVVYDEAW